MTQAVAAVLALVLEAGLLAEKGAPPTFKHDNKTYMARSPGTTRNFNTAWWDASQI